MLAGLSGSYFWILPRLQLANALYSQSEAQLIADSDSLNALQKVSAQVKSVDLALREQGVDLKKAQKVLPPSEEMPSLYIQMETVVSQAQANIGSPTYTLGTPVKDVSTGSVQIPITLSGNGDYLHLKAFLGSFEQNIRPVTFTQISFTVAAPSAQASTSADKTTTKGVVSLVASGYVRATGLSSSYTVAPTTH